MARSVEIANEFLKRKPFTQMQLQKLAFIANGFTLAITGNRLVDETYEAWNLGPVESELRDHISHNGSRPIHRLITDRDKAMRFMFSSEGEPTTYRADLTNVQCDIIDRVFSKYGSLSAFTLSELTHQPDSPWFRAFTQGRNTEILDADIIEHYQSLMTPAGG